MARRRPRGVRGGAACWRNDGEGRPRSALVMPRTGAATAGKGEGYSPVRPGEPPAGPCGGAARGVGI